MKQLAEYTFRELVETCEGNILQDLLQGRFHNGVYEAMNMAVRWHIEKEAQKEEQKRQCQTTKK